MPGAHLRSPRPDGGATDISRIVYRADRAVRGSCVRVPARCAGRRSRLRPAGGRQRARRLCSSSGRSTWTCRRSSRARRAACDGAGGRGARGRSVARSSPWSGSPAPTARPPAHSCCTPCSRPPAIRAGLIGTIEARVGGVVEAVMHTTPESVDLQHLLARMRDAGDTACAMEVSSHALAQRRVAGLRFAAALFTNLTRDHLDYHADVEEYYLAKRALFIRPDGEGPNPPGAANLDDEFGRRLAAESGALGLRGRPPADVHPSRSASRAGLLGTDRDAPRGRSRSQSPLRGRVQHLQRHRASWRWGSCWASITTPSPVASPPSAGCRDGSSRSTRASRSRCSSTTPTRPTRSTTCCARRASSSRTAGAWSWCSAAAAIATAASARRWARSPRRLADIAIVTSDNPRSEDPDAIIDEIVAGAASGPAELIVEADRRQAIVLATELAGGRRRGGHRGQGA